MGSTLFELVRQQMKSSKGLLAKQLTCLPQRREYTPVSLQSAAHHLLLWLTSLTTVLGLWRPYTVHPSFSRKFQNPFSMRNTSLESITPPSRYTNNCLRKLTSFMRSISAWRWQGITLGKRMPKGGTISRFLTQFNSHHSSWAPIVWKLRIRLTLLWEIVKNAMFLRNGSS